MPPFQSNQPLFGHCPEGVGTCRRGKSWRNIVFLANFFFFFGKLSGIKKKGTVSMRALSAVQGKLFWVEKAVL
jgi:hypothetical protein